MSEQINKSSERSTYKKTPSKQHVRWARKVADLRKVWKKSPTTAAEVQARLDKLTPAMHQMLEWVVEDAGQGEVSRTALAVEHGYDRLQSYQVHSLQVLTAMRLLQEHDRALPMERGNGAEKCYSVDPVTLEVVLPVVQAKIAASKEYWRKLQERKRRLAP